jgi:hypothetical protein
LGNGDSAKLQAFVSSAIAGNVQIPKDVMKSSDLDEVERRITPFVDTVWGIARDVRTPRSQFWELMTRFSRRTICNAASNETADQIAPVSDEEWPPPGSASNMRWFLSLVASEYQLGDTVELVYGHTHSGGSFPIPWDKRTVRCTNTGGWVTCFRNTVPHSHVTLFDNDLNILSDAMCFSDGARASAYENGAHARALDPGPFPGESRERLFVTSGPLMGPPPPPPTPRRSRVERSEVSRLRRENRALKAALVALLAAEED